MIFKRFVKQHRSWTVVTLLITQTAFTQKLNLGFGTGAMNYKGDLAPIFNPKLSLPGIHALVRYNISQSVSLRANGLIGAVGASDEQSSDPFNQIRNQSFRSIIAEASLITEYNFLDYGARRKDVNWTPYLFGGLSRYRFQPQDRSGTYSLNQWAIPFGVGVKYEFKRPWNIEFEYGTRKLFTDNLDNLGTNVPPGQKYRQGDQERNDIYYYFSVTLSYTFYSIWCPEGVVE